MSDSDSALSFIRQRRDLFVISALLSVAQLAHFRINETLSLFGASITVGNPIVLTLSLWALWGYWLVRYIQFFLREKGIEKIKGAIFNRVRESLARRAAILFQRDPSINVFQPREVSFGSYDIEFEGGLKVEFPHRLAEGVRIFLYKNGLAYEYWVPRGEYFGFAALKLPHVIFVDTEFTDYIFPFLFAFAPLAIFIYQN